MSAPVRSAGVTRVVLVALELTAGIGAVYVGAGLIAGNAIGMPEGWPASTLFPDWCSPASSCSSSAALPCWWPRSAN